MTLAHGAVATELPLPTTPQLAWQNNEIMALIHFNMATFCAQPPAWLPPITHGPPPHPILTHSCLAAVQNGDPGCDAANWAQSSKPASFAPARLNVSNWIESMHALGVQEAVLTAKHGCGFLLWNTSTRLPSGAPYTYHVPPELNVLQQFSEAMEAAGLGHGFYYSLT